MATYSEKLKDPRWQKKRLGIFNRTSVQMSYLESVIRDAVKEGVFHG